MRPEKGSEITLRIERLAYGGRGVARHDGYVVFVPQAAEGDLVRARVTKSKRTFGEADIVEVLEPGPGRTEPPCPYFGRCGGCTWQHLDYPAQLRAKEAVVRESFEHLAKLGSLPYRPVVGDPDPWRYRNKMEFAFHPDGSLGLHWRGRFDRILDVEDCLIAPAAVHDVLSVVRTFAHERGLPGYDKRTHQGFLRHLVVREGVRSGELMVALVTTDGALPDADELVRRLLAARPEIASILWARTDNEADVVQVDRLDVLHGAPHIHDALHGTRYRIGLETFFQTNTDQADRMAERVLELAELKGDEKVFDLYCGVGTFALLMAPHVRHVWGIEVVERSIEAARRNAGEAGLHNTTFLAGDARRTLAALVEEVGPPDVFVLDPPRSGTGGKVMRRIGRSRAKRVVYVSCNPTTLAPDLEHLLPYGYDITAVQPLDLFPQTYHVETLVRLDLVREPDEGVK